MSTELHDVELAANPDQKVACVLLLDTSGSMKGERIAALNEGLRTFKDAVAGDDITRSRVDVCVIAFDSDISTVKDFGSIDGFDPPQLTAQNQTFLGSAIIEALDKLEQRKETYKANGIAFYRPWLFLITDGLPEGEDPAVLERAKAKLRRAQDRKAVVVYAVGVGDVDLDKLQEITGSPPVRMKDKQWKAMFEWLSRSLESVSKSTPGAQIRLPDAHWATMQTK